MWKIRLSIGISEVHVSQVMLNFRSKNGRRIYRGQPVQQCRATRPSCEVSRECYLWPPDKRPVGKRVSVDRRCRCLYNRASRSTRRNSFTHGSILTTFPSTCNKPFHVFLSSRFSWQIIMPYRRNPGNSIVPIYNSKITFWKEYEPSLLLFIRPGVNPPTET